MELIIIGGGPAGTAAGVYAARKQIQTTLIAEAFGGQSIVSPDIKNWIGTTSISGSDFAESFKKHLQEYERESLTIQTQKVTKVIKEEDTFTVTMDNGETLKGKALLIASGADRKKLGVPGADTFEHKGLTYCASCDGPLFAGKDVVVIGGGNAGFETAAQLLAYAKSVTLLHRGEAYKADSITVKKVLEHENMTGMLKADITGVTGETFVSGITYKKDGEDHTLAVEGVFVEIGLIPATEFIRDIVKTDTVGRIIVDPKNQRTSDPMVWAAGDCSDGTYHQNNIAAGDAVKALEDAYLALRAK